MSSKVPATATVNSDTDISRRKGAEVVFEAQLVYRQRVIMMFSIQNNLMATNAYRNLQNAGFTMGKAMEKLSSGYRINTAADGPADLVASEQLRAKIEGLERALRNTTETGNVLDITDGALGEIQNILRDMRQLTIHSMNSGVTTAEQTAAEQSQMDVALQSIDRIINTTNYAGRKLLDNLNLGGGSSGLGTGNMVVNGENLDTVAKNEIPLTFNRNAAKDGIIFTPNGQAKTNTEPLVDENGLLVADKTFTVPGADGDPANQTSFHFSAGTSLTDIVAELRGHAMTQEEIDQLDPDFAASASRQGDDIDRVDMSLDTLAHVQGLNDADAEQFVKNYMTNFTPQQYALDFEKIDLSHLSEGEKKLYDLSQNLMNMSMGGLGSVEVTSGYDENGKPITKTVSLYDMFSGGAASLGKDPDAALSVIKQATKDVLGMRAQIGATRAYAIQSSENLLRSEIESYTRAESFLRDTDMASGMVEFTRSKLVSQVGTQMLSTAMDHNRSILDLLA